MNVSTPDAVRSKLLDGRARLVATIDQVADKADLRELLTHVDAALNRLSVGTYGSCEICREPIEGRRLRVDPLTCYCSSHLTLVEQVRVTEDHRDDTLQASFRALDLVAQQYPVPGSPASRIPATSLVQRMLDALTARLRVFVHKKDHQGEVDREFSLASIVQLNLLPKCGLCFDGWQTYYKYTPAGKVGGDYCDLIKSEAGDLFFFFGDVVGKGVPGSIIAAKLHGVFRALVSPEFQLKELKEMFERANRLFCESTPPDYYATVICGRASPKGNLEIVNAGHPSPFILRSGEAIPLPATGLPLGLFYTSTYDVTKVQLTPGEALVCYTDGFTEARNRWDAEYGITRFANFVAQRSHLSPQELVQACVDDLTAFTSNSLPSDDCTVMALRHVPQVVSRAAASGLDLEPKKTYPLDL